MWREPQAMAGIAGPALGSLWRTTAIRSARPAALFGKGLKDKKRRRGDLRRVSFFGRSPDRKQIPQGR